MSRSVCPGGSSRKNSRNNRALALLESSKASSRSPGWAVGLMLSHYTAATPSSGSSQFLLNNRYLQKTSSAQLTIDAPNPGLSERWLRTGAGKLAALPVSRSWPRPSFSMLPFLIVPLPSQRPHALPLCAAAGPAPPAPLTEFNNNNFYLFVSPRWFCPNTLSRDFKFFSFHAAHVHESVTKLPARLS